MPRNDIFCSHSGNYSGQENYVGKYLHTLIAVRNKFSPASRVSVSSVHPQVNISTLVVYSAYVCMCWNVLLESRLHLRSINCRTQSLHTRRPKSVAQYCSIWHTVAALLVTGTITFPTTCGLQHKKHLTKWKTKRLPKNYQLPRNLCNKRQQLTTINTHSYHLSCRTLVKKRMQLHAGILTQNISAITVRAYLPSQQQFR